MHWNNFCATCGSLQVLVNTDTMIVQLPKLTTDSSSFVVFPGSFTNNSQQQLFEKWFGENETEMSFDTE